MFATVRETADVKPQTRLHADDQQIHDVRQLAEDPFLARLDL